MITILLISFVLIILILIWALSGNEQPDELNLPPEKLYRRRASDLEIEKADKKDNKFKKKKRSTVKQDDESEFTDETEIEDDFELPYNAPDIIPAHSRYRIYLRTLQNAEIYAEKGDFTTAISLYSGVNDRILDEETNKKIEANIEYLKKYKSLKEIESKNRKKQKSSISNEIKIVLDNPYQLPEKIHIGLTQPDRVDTKLIVEEISKKILENKEKQNIENELINNYKKEIENLNNKIQELKSHINEHLEKESAQQNINENPQIQQLQNQIQELSDKLLVINKEKEETKNELEQLKKINKQINEQIFTENKPQVTTVKYEGKLPVEIDHDSIMKLFEKIPQVTAPPSKPISPKNKSNENLPDTTNNEISRKFNEIINKEVEDDSEDWELISNMVKDERKSSLDDVSDEDIFQKILESDKNKKDDEIEIIGDHKNIDAEYDFEDEQTLKKIEEERKFYEKFLQHNRRKKKELPILKVTYDFNKLPDEFSLSREKNILEYSFYKYKPLLEKADQLIKQRKVRDALNYYKVVMSQNIPPEFKSMIRKNINDLNEYLEKYLTSD